MTRLLDVDVDVACSEELHELYSRAEQGGWISGWFLRLGVWGVGRTYVGMY